MNVYTHDTLRLECDCSLEEIAAVFSLAPPEAQSLLGGCDHELLFLLERHLENSKCYRLACVSATDKAKCAHRCARQFESKE